ncbi:MAG: tetratricopeptide repeat protein [Treponema sp.]|jgi:TolA-binding protein|nr:tetratricopeptide repeat protein [Treponema sp.]
MIQKIPSLFGGSLLLFFAAAAAYGQAPAYTPRDSRTLSAAPVPSLSPRLREGIRLYGEGRWRDAAVELRRAQSESADPEQQAEALYWIALSELSAGDYEASLRDMDELARIHPAGPRRAELPYHRGRAYYYLGRYDEAVVILKDYADREGEGMRKSAALYWIGECLYALGRLDEARDLFTLITEQYPQSAKYEASTYRIDLINQKKIEIELLALLKWSHEESLRIMEEYQRRERSYDQALVAYQKRISDLLRDAGGVSAPAAASPEPDPLPPDIRTRALDLRNEMEREMKRLESNGNGGVSR